MIIKKELQPVEDSLQLQQSIDTNSNKQKNNSSISSEMSLIYMVIFMILFLWYIYNRSEYLEKIKINERERAIEKFKDETNNKKLTWPHEQNEQEEVLRKLQNEYDDRLSELNQEKARLEYLDRQLGSRIMDIKPDQL